MIEGSPKLETVILRNPSCTFTNHAFSVPINTVEIIKIEKKNDTIDDKIKAYKKDIDTYSKSDCEDISH